MRSGVCQSLPFSLLPLWSNLGDSPIIFWIRWHWYLLRQEALWPEVRYWVMTQIICRFFSVVCTTLYVCPRCGLHFRSVKWYCRIGLARNQILFLQGKNFVRWIAWVVLAYWEAERRMKCLHTYRKLNCPSPFCSISGADRMSGYWSKVRYTHQQWCWYCYMDPEKGGWRQWMCEDFPCFNTKAIALHALACENKIDSKKILFQRHGCVLSKWQSAPIPIASIETRAQRYQLYRLH